MELSQSQFTTTAEINAIPARYEYLLRRSILDFAIGVMK